MTAARAKQLRRNLMSIRQLAVSSPKIADALAIEAVASTVRGGAALRVASAASHGGPQSVSRVNRRLVGLPLAPIQRRPLK
jgi:hypothetical protein